MIFSLKKAMEYGPKSQEVQHILEQIFNYYGIVSNKSTFTLDDVLLMYRIIRTWMKKKEEVKGEEKTEIDKSLSEFDSLFYKLLGGTNE